MKNLVLKLILLLPLATPGFAENRLVKIGLVTDMSGGAAFYGEQEVAAARLAAEGLKNEGIDLQLIFEDSQLKPQTGLSAVNKLLSVDKVDGLYITFTAVVNAAIETVKRSNTLLIYSAGARSPKQKYDYAFKTYIDYVDGCELLAKYFATHKKNLAFLKAQAEYGELCGQGISRSGADVFIQEYQKDADLSTQILKIKDYGATALIDAGFTSDTINMLKAAQRIGYAPLFADSDYVFTKDVLREFKKELEGSLAFGIVTHRPEAYNRRHLELIKGKELGVIDYAALAHLHMQQMARAIAGCPRADVACQAAKLSAAPAAPDWGFLGWQDRVAKMDLKLKRVLNGAFQIEQ